VTGLILIPTFGVKQTMEIGVLFNGILCALILFSDAEVSPRLKMILPAVFVIGSLLYRIEYPRWNELFSTIGVFRVLGQGAPPSYQDFINQYKNMSLLYYKEGVDANVSVVDKIVVGSDQREKSLIINGKADASSVSDLNTQILLAQIPLIVYPNTGSALVI
jgi:hypothetical protein